MGITDDLRKMILAEIKTRGETVNSFAEASGTQQGSLSIFLRGGGLHLKTLAKLLDFMGAKVVRPGETLASDGKPISPELVDIDEMIKSMRKVGASDEAIWREVSAAAQRNFNAQKTAEHGTQKGQADIPCGR